MNGKTVLIFAGAVAIFLTAAQYRFHDSAHAMGMIRKGGGMARHPALLDKDRDSYMLIATAGVMAPYRGNARVVLEGAPAFSAAYHNSEPAIDLGLHRHPKFHGDIYYDLQPRDKVALWVRIKRSGAKAIEAAGAAAQRSAEPLCTQCEPEEHADDGSRRPGNSTGERPARRDVAAAAPPRQQLPVNKGQQAGVPGRGRRGAAVTAGGPALAFYDTATNEPLLRIPIRFINGKGGRDDEH